MAETKQRQVKGVVVGVDGSSRDESTVAYATREAALRGWPLQAVHVEESSPPVLEVLTWPPTEVTGTSGSLLHHAAAVANRVDASVEVTIAAHGGRPENVMQELSGGASLIVVGDGGQGRGDTRRFGTVTLNVAAHAKCPVLVVGQVPATEHGRVLVGVDGSGQSRAAVQLAAEEARLRGAELVLHTSWHIEVVDGVVVTEPGSQRWLAVERRIRRMQEKVLAEALGQGRPSVAVTHEIVNGRSTDTLVVASEHADLVVVGNRGRGGFLGKLLGSVTMGLLRRSHCPVLVARLR